MFWKGFVRNFKEVYENLFKTRLFAPSRVSTVLFRCTDVYS